MKWLSYYRLMRLDKPVGIWLLWFPTAWSLWIANHGKPPFALISLFFLGTIFMRSAGCVVNDMADRHFDIHVKRTKTRPLACGEITFFRALILLGSLLSLSLLILWQLPPACFYYAFFAVFISVIYPFAKRFIQAPQMVLGIAFSMGIPMAFAASGVPFDSTVIYLMLINFLWIVAYDTQYAMADREDDLRIGVKSSAILFAHYDCLLIGLLQFVCHGLWFILAISLGLSYPFFMAWCLGLGILLYQQKIITTRKSEVCLRAFSSNVWYGLIIWLGLVFSSQ